MPSLLKIGREGFCKGVFGSLCAAAKAVDQRPSKAGNNADVSLLAPLQGLLVILV